MRWWKVLGIAGLAGVAATGGVVARNQRQRRRYTPEEVKDRLHERLAESSDPAASDATGKHSDRSKPGVAGTDFIE